MACWQKIARFLPAAGERGGSIVVAAVALPLLLIFLLAILDVGRVVFLAAEANTAAHAVRCLVMEQEDLASHPDDLSKYALGASPSLESEGLDVVVEAKVGAVERQKYNHKLFDGEKRKFFERAAQVTTRSLEVTVSVRGQYLTPVGALIAQASGGWDASFVCEARVRGLIDGTIEGGAW